ncbi:MAG: hypothetical protein HUK19_06765 [Fibrobacter sp.]|nr:hypothetical protein [Fibrobacter sp.]
MNRKILTLLTAATFMLFLNACGDDNSSSSGPDITCEDSENCLDDDENTSSSSEDSDDDSEKEKPASSSSKKNNSKSSSSVKEDKKSSSSKAKDEGKSSSSEKIESSSSEKVTSSSSEDAESSSSEESKTIEYKNTTPNLADLEVSGDTLFALFQRQNADYSITNTGLLAMFKLEDGTFLDTIPLTTKNPSAVKIVGDNAFVATSGPYDASYNLPADNNRGIEKVDLKKKTSSLYISGTKLGGGVSDFVVDKKNKKGYAAIYLTYGSVVVKEIDFATSSIKAIDGILDASGSLEFDEENSTLYISDRFMDWNTYEMHIGVFAYKNGTLTAVSDADPEEEFRMPLSIKAIKGIPYVFVSDYASGALYVDYADSESDGVKFYQDSRLAAVNDELFLMERNLASSTLAKINTADGSAVWQISLSGSNPYDMVAASSTTAWIAYYGSPILELISTSTGSSETIIDTKIFCAK